MTIIVSAPDIARAEITARRTIQDAENLKQTRQITAADRAALDAAIQRLKNAIPLHAGPFGTDYELPVLSPKAQPNSIAVHDAIRLFVQKIVAKTAALRDEIARAKQNSSPRRPSQAKPLPPQPPPKRPNPPPSASPTTHPNPTGPAPNSKRPPRSTGGGSPTRPHHSYNSGFGDGGFGQDGFGEGGFGQDGQTGLGSFLGGLGLSGTAYQPGGAGPGTGPGYAPSGGGSPSRAGAFSGGTTSGDDFQAGFGGGGNFWQGGSAPTTAADPHQGQVLDVGGQWATPQPLPSPPTSQPAQGQGQQQTASVGGDTPAEDPGTDKFGYGGDPIDDSGTASGGPPVEDENDPDRAAASAGQEVPEYTGDQQSGSSTDDPNNVDPSIVTTDGGGGTPNPDDPDSGGSESPRVHKGMGGGPQHDYRNPPAFPDPPTGVSAVTGPFAGWTSGADGDWGGNPHENPDPEDTGSGGVNPAALAANNTNPDDVPLPSIPNDAGAAQDEFWGGNNPHYMPYLGAAWTPFTNVAPMKKASTASRVIVRAGNARFR